MGGILKTEELNALLQPVIESMGYEFEGCEYVSQGRFSTLRVYIDKKEGITADDCGAVSRQVGALLDVESKISQQYNLEVSSPGLDRPLFDIEDFKKFIKHEVDIRLKAPMNERANFKGVIEKVDGNKITVICDGEEFVLVLEKIAKANVVPKFK